jgi:GTP-binding protein
LTLFPYTTLFRSRANPGEVGEQGVYRLVLKTIADVGLVGFPNAGKSTLVGRITKARPKTAAYPFTTLQPQIGVIDYPDKAGRLLLADVPGLIEGASENRGLGHRFLRHIERCSLLLFLIDMAAVDGRDPREDFATLVSELELYDTSLMQKPRVVVANKMDLPAAKAKLAAFKRRHDVTVIPISSLEGEGVDKLLRALWTKVRGRRTQVRPTATA